MKNRVLDILNEKTKEFGLSVQECFTTSWLSSELDLKRNSISQYLNELVLEGKLIKINTRPVYFFSKEALIELGYHIPCQSFDDFESLEKCHEGKDFETLIGYDGSLFHVVEQCKAAVCYPPQGLPILFTGPTGSGKSLLAKTMYDYAVNEGFIEEGKRFVVVNCSEYANNPELLTANLFGYCKGAYTGADKDNPGLIQLADGGFLFLDEVQSLKAECQEKLFLFMDKGIYHRLGDNKTWHRASCHMAFATTENPEDVLLKTLLRRIPIITKIPSLVARGENERKELITQLFRKEGEEIKKRIEVSYLAWQVLMNVEIEGNVGGLINAIKVTCANAFLHNQSEDDVLKIYSYDLPDALLQMASSVNLNLQEDGEIRMLKMSVPVKKNTYGTQLTRLYESLLDMYHLYLQDPLSHPLFDDNHLEEIERFNDEIVYDNFNSKNMNSDFVLKITDKVCSLAINRYSLHITNNDILLISHYVKEYARNKDELMNWVLQNKEDVKGLSDVVRMKYPREYAIADEMSENLKLNLDIEIDEMMKVRLMLMMTDCSVVEQGKTVAVILCHGYSTASSIAGAVNRMLGQHIFDSIDMQLDLSVTKIIDQLNSYLRMKSYYENIVLLVDMGSLEEIDQGIKQDHAVNIGIINNVNTKLALSVGNYIQQGYSLKEILEKAVSHNVTQSRYIESKKQEKAILSVCVTGEGTAEKILALFEKSLPCKIDAKIIPYDFKKLEENGMQDAIFSRYDVAFIMGTMSPDIEEIPYIAVEELLFGNDFEKLNAYMSCFLNEEELKEFNHNIVMNFTLNNLVTQLTILNAEKVLMDVEEIVEQIEEGMQIQLPTENRMGLYLHLACLIERLILKNGIQLEEPPTEFLEENKKFVEVVKDAFSVVNVAYSVEIPDSEIVYIFNYIKNVA